MNDENSIETYCSPFRPPYPSDKIDPDRRKREIVYLAVLLARMRRHCSQTTRTLHLNKNRSSEAISSRCTMLDLGQYTVVRHDGADDQYPSLQEEDREYRGIQLEVRLLNNVGIGRNAVQILDDIVRDATELVVI